MTKRLLDKINTRTARVLVVGAGYVGLPLAVRCAEEGFPTIIYDIDENKIESVNKGVSYIEDILSTELSPLIHTGKLRGIWALEKLIPRGKINLKHPDVILICVPTPLNKRHDPDISFIVSAAEALVSESVLQDEQLVVLESTVYPGFTKEVLLPALGESLDEPFVAFSPERVDPGNKKFNIKNTPKVVGGIGSEATQLAVAFYEQIIDQVVQVSSAETAEMTKVYENTFRMINIAFTNEVSLICKCLGIDVWEMIEAANTKPFGFMKFTPGLVGGHCLPCDPHYLSWKLGYFKYRSKFIELAEEINASMPKEIIRLTTEALNSIKKSINGSKIVVIGVAYKPDVSDLRESLALDIIKTLKEKGADVLYYDPHVPLIKFDDGDMRSLPSILGSFDCAIIATNHSCINYEEVLECAHVVVDSRNALEGIQNKNNIPIFRL